MSDSPHHSFAPLTLIKGGRLSPKEFSELPFPAKLEHLQRVRGNAKYKLIIEDAEAPRLTHALMPQEFYQLVHEVGAEDTVELLTLASPSQIEFILDQETWDRYQFSLEKAVEWFGHLLECGDEKVYQTLAILDQEMLILFLKMTVIVAGGLSDELDGDEQQGEWDHSFDNTYYLKIKDTRNGQLALRLLDIIYRRDHTLYLFLMEGVKNEMETELEELCYHFRTGRLSDAGFPPLEEALVIYTRLTPDTFVPATDKELVGPIDNEQLPALVGEETSFLHRVLKAADSPLLRQELQYLLNTALVADAVSLADHEGMTASGSRIEGYLTVALEYLSSGDEQQALAIVRGEHLKRLFQLGFSILATLQEKAKTTSTDNYAANKVILGLKERRPRFYRGLDADRVDGYREFRDLEDIRTIDQFLRTLQEA